MLKEQEEELKKSATKNGIFFYPTDEQLNQIKEDMLKGNIPAFLQILLNNQRIMNEKLNKLLERSEKDGKES